MGQRRRAQPQSCSRALQSRSGSRDSLTLRHGRFASAPAVKLVTIPVRLHQAAEGQRFHTVLRVTGSAKGNY